METYRTFKRSATSWATMFRARKITVDTGLSRPEAVEQCKAYNDNRTSRQIKKGTMMEFIQE